VISGGLGSEGTNRRGAEISEISEGAQGKAEVNLNNDSGPKRGKRSIHGGHSHVRRGLYMPMMSAVRFNPILNEFYERLIERNKPHHVALVAAMRKMIRLLNRMLADPDFQPAT
jgi:hypothetical protein